MAHLFYRWISVVLFCASPSLRAAPGPVTVDASFRAAVQRSETVKKSEEQIAQADAQRSQAIGAVLPNVGFNLTHLIQPLPSDPIAQQFSPQHQTTMAFSVRQPLFKGLSEFNGLSALNHLREAMRSNREWALSQLFQTVTSNYLQILTQEKDLKNLGDQIEIYEKRLEDLRGRVQRGESEQTDVVSAESKQAALLAETKLVESELGSARELFNFWTGFSHDAELIDPDIASAKTLLPLDVYLKRVERRADVRTALEKYEATEKKVAAAWGLHSPTLDVLGNYYLKRPGFFKDLRWDITLQLKVPLFEGGATQSKVTEALSVKNDARLDLELARRTAHREIRTLYQRLLARFDHVQKLEISAQLSKKNSSLQQRNYQKGLVRNIDVQLALTDYQVAQRAFDKAHFDVQNDMYQLRVAAAMVPAVSERNNP